MGMLEGMRYSTYFVHCLKTAREYESVNATLLQKGGFIYQVMAGVYGYLPLGLRVLNKIEGIVREEMDKIAYEILLPSLSPMELWEKTGRHEKIDVLFSARGGNEASRAKNGAEYVLNSTHEELTVPILQQLAPSYRDLPKAVYQIQTKFRNEPRAKSGLLRGREFRMKDLYSFHLSEEDFGEFYDRMKEVYTRTFARLGLGEDTHMALASGGDFTNDYSHEFQAVCETGEDVIYFDEKEGVYYNREVASEELQASGQALTVSEVGNIFPLGTRFAEAFGYSVQDQDGKSRPVVMGSYGIGTSRVMGVLVEKFHDERGIMWPEQVAPFAVQLVSLGNDMEVLRWAQDVYSALEKAGLEVLFDDREASPGEKMADADLLGMPWRVVVSKRTGGQIELKQRSREVLRVVDLEEAIRLMADGAG